jgi:hypothetical protein
VPVEAADTGWRLRFFAAGFDPDLDTTVTNSDGDDIRVTADTDLGYGVSLEYRFSDLVGLELGVSAGDPDVELSAEVPPFGDVLLSDSLSTRVVTLDVDFHLTPGSPSLDFYLGAGIADVSYGDLHYVGPDDEPLDLRISGDYTWSAKVGLDIALGGNGKWGAGPAQRLRYLCLRHLQRFGRHRVQNLTGLAPGCAGPPASPGGVDAVRAVNPICRVSRRDGRAAPGPARRRRTLAARFRLDAGREGC